MYFIFTSNKIISKQFEMKIQFRMLPFYPTLQRLSTGVFSMNFRGMLAPQTSADNWSWNWLKMAQSILIIAPF